MNSEPRSLYTIRLPFSLSSSNDLIHISTMLMKPHHHHPVAQMGQMLEFSLPWVDLAMDPGFLRFLFWPRQSLGLKESLVPAASV